MRISKEQIHELVKEIRFSDLVDFKLPKCKWRTIVTTGTIRSFTMDELNGWKNHPDKKILKETLRRIKHYGNHEYLVMDKKGYFVHVSKDYDNLENDLIRFFDLEGFEISDKPLSMKKTGNISFDFR